MDLESLPAEIQFIFISMMQSAIYFKKMEQDKKFFINFAREIWMTMEMNDIEILEETIQKKMKKDIDPCVKEYLDRQKK